MFPVTKEKFKQILHLYLKILIELIPRIRKFEKQSLNKILNNLRCNSY